MLSVRPDALKDLHCRAGHIDAIVLLAPIQIEIAAWKVTGTCSFLATCEYSGHARCTGPGAARHGNSAAPLPGPHRKCRRVIDLNEVDVDSVGKELVVFDSGPECA